MPQKIYADIPFGKYNSFLVDDEATITMRYDDKLTAVFMLTTGEAVWEERLEIIGTKGKLLLEDDTLSIYRYSEDSTEYMKTSEDNSREKLTVSTELIHFEKSAEPYIPMLENFVNAVEGKAELIAKGESAVNALMLANAAYYSAWTEESVSLPLDANSYSKLLAEHCKSEN
jgi:predicted dehydrogenase